MEKKVNEEIELDFGSMNLTPEIKEVFQEKKEKVIQDVEEDIDFNNPTLYETKEEKKEELQEIITDSFEHVNLQQAQADYEIRKQIEDAKPIVHEAVQQATSLQRDEFKLEVAETLHDEVTTRLDKYEKRRQWRHVKDKISFCIKLLVVVIVLIFTLGNTKIRTRLGILCKDFYNLTIGIIDGDDVSSNQLVDDTRETVKEIKDN